MSGGSSLAELLVIERGARKRWHVPRITCKQILKWADAHHRRTGVWPIRDSGPIVDAPGENWLGINMALYLGQRGLPGGSSLAKLLHGNRRVYSKMLLEPLSEEQILTWAKAYFKQHGCWPQCTSGRVAGSEGETWSSVNSFL